MEPLNASLAGRVALVTGAGQGMGRVIAHVLAAHGAAVAVNDLNPDTAGATAGSIAEAGGTSVTVPGDVSSASQVRQMVEQARQLGPIGILVNNAAYMSMQRLIDLPEAEWDRVIDVDLKGPYLMSRAVLPDMLSQQWGRIVSTASEFGIVGGAGATHYSAAKAGVIGFTRALAHEVAAAGIRVNAIAPGYVDTPQLGVDAGYEGKTLDQFKRDAAAHIPIGRLGLPRDIALTVLFLCLESGDYYTGQVLTPNGGTS